MERVATGSAELDRLLGGYENDIVTVIYGPAGSGKTNLCLMCAAAVAQRKKVIFIDTDGGFSVERLKQITPDAGVLERLMVLRPTSLKEQERAVKGVLGVNAGLVVVDTIVTLFRLAKGTAGAYDLARDFGLQVSELSDMARNKNIPVLLTSQVYGRDDEVSMVRGDLLRYVAKCIIRLDVLNGTRRLTVEKHRSLPQKQLDFRIVDSGIAIPR